MQKLCFYFHIKFESANKNKDLLTVLLINHELLGFMPFYVQKNLPNSATVDENHKDVKRCSTRKELT